MLETETIKVKDMFCRQCEARITEARRGLEGVSAVAVSFDTGNVRVTYDKGICSRDRLLAVIEETGYTAAEENSVNTVVNGISVIVILLAAWYILNAFHLNIVFQKFPVATEGMNYAMLFAIGILTSFHCIAMCGGLNLAATARAEKKAAFYYNLGRLLSYTMIGGLLGLLGSFISINLRIRAVIGLAAAVIMLFLGVRLMNCFPIKIPFQRKRNFGIRGKFLRKGSGSFYIGLLNGFMPCGPLQAMQILAISAGSFISGSLSLFFFCLGTIPLMLVMGLAASHLTAKAKNRMALFGGALVFVFGIYMLQNNLALLGVSVFQESGRINQANIVEAVEQNGIQQAESTLKPGSYDVLKVKAGIPVQWIVYAGKDALNGCNSEIVIPAYNLDIRLQEGENLIEFTPGEAGTIKYSCWMGMIKSEIIVTD